MSIPKQPRQIMINMMYLVLTALLALNVSTEVLNAFKLIDDGLVNTNEHLLAKSNSQMFDFRTKMAYDSVRTKPFYESAQHVQQSVDRFVGYVESLREQMIVESGGFDDDGSLNNKKDVDTPTRIMLNQKHGEELERRIEALRRVLANVDALDIDPQEILSKISLTTSYNKVDARRKGKTNWTAYNFEKVPVVAAVTLLSKLKTDARSAELMVIGKLYEEVDGASYKFDKLSAKWISPSTYVVAGNEPFIANIFMSATSSTQEAEVFIGDFREDLNLFNEQGTLIEQISEFPLKDGYTSLEVKGGMANFESLPSTAGTQHVQGVLKVKTPSGDDYNYFPFELNYRSAKADAVVSPDKMNVLYIGVENPLSISAPGIAAENIRASIDQGRLRGGNGDYLAMVNQTGLVNVNVKAQMRDGSLRRMGSQQFRVKKIPNPEIKLGNIKPGKVQVHIFRPQNGLNAKLEDFVFETQFEVVSFKMMGARQGQIILDEAVEGPVYNNRMKRAARNAERGDTYYFDEVIVRVPGGELRNLNTIIYIII